MVLYTSYLLYQETCTTDGETIVEQATNHSYRMTAGGFWIQAISAFMSCVLAASLIPIPAYADLAVDSESSQVIGGANAEIVDHSTEGVDGFAGTSEYSRYVISETNSSSSQAVSMYRLYNPNSGEHFYTADVNERASVAKAGWNDEGYAWTAPVESNAPVFRLYSGTDHHYTTDSAERDYLQQVGWSYEGIGWYSDDAKGVPLYRQYNPNVDPGASSNNSGSHNYTTSKDENDYLVSIGWHGEGIGWYGCKATDPSPAPSPSNPPTPPQPSNPPAPTVTPEGVTYTDSSRVLQDADIVNVSGDTATIAGSKAETIVSGSVLLIEPSEANPTGSALYVKSVSKQGSTATVQTRPAELSEAIETANFEASSGKILSLTPKVPMTGREYVEPRSRGNGASLETQALDTSLELEAITLEPFANCEVTIIPSVSASLDYAYGVINSCKVVANVNVTSVFEVEREWSKDIELADVVLQLPYGFAVKASIVLTAGVSGRVHVEVSLDAAGGFEYDGSEFTPVGECTPDFNAEAEANVWLGLRPGLSLTCFGIVGIVGLSVEAGVKADASVHISPGLLCMDLDAYPYVDISIDADTLMSMILEWLRLGNTFNVLDETNSIISNIHFENNVEVSACTWTPDKDSTGTESKPERASGVKDFKRFAYSLGEDFFALLEDGSLWMWGDVSSSPVRIMSDVKSFNVNLDGGNSEACMVVTALCDDGSLWQRSWCYDSCTWHSGLNRFRKLASGVKQYSRHASLILKSNGSLCLYSGYDKKYHEFFTNVKDIFSGAWEDALTFVTTSDVLYYMSCGRFEAYDSSDKRIDWGIRPYIVKIREGVSSIEIQDYARFACICADGSLVAGSTVDVFRGGFPDGGKYSGVSPYLVPADKVGSVKMASISDVRDFGFLSSDGCWALKSDGTLWKSDAEYTAFTQILDQVRLVGSSCSTVVKTDGTMWIDSLNGWEELCNQQNSVDIHAVDVTTTPSVLIGNYPEILNSANNLIEGGFIDRNDALWVFGFQHLDGVPRDSWHCSSDFYKIMNGVRGFSSYRHRDESKTSWFIIKSDGSLWVKGANGHGQLGIGTTESTDVFTKVKFVG